MATGEFHNKRVVVMGLGRFGGGIGVTRWLCSQGARVTVTDMATKEKLADSLELIADLSVTLRLGGHDEADLDGCDLLVVSPAVPRDKSPFVQAAIGRGVPVSSEMNLFVERCRARRVIGITGSAGKSTTTMMLGSILSEAAGAGALPGAWTGGNIGASLLGELERIEPDHVVALELSSFQLEDLGALRWSPQLAAVTNIQPNHLDRHGTLEAYADAKLNIVRYQRGSDAVFIHACDRPLADRVRAVGAAGRIERYAFDDRFAGDLTVPGPHNRTNAAAAIALARELRLDDVVISRGLRGFKGLPHRLELVGEVDGVRYYNDSKSTTPESTRIALDAFEEPLVLLVGGSSKGSSFVELAGHIARKAKAVVCYGATGPQILSDIVEARATGAVLGSIDLAADFAQAVRKARAAASPGDVVVLSPACASYDMFTNYEHRGAEFQRQITAADGEPA